MKNLNIVLLLLLFFATSLFSSQISTSEPTYRVGDPIIINLEHGPVNPQDWLAIYTNNSSTAWENVIKYQWVTDDNVYTFNNLAPGTYRARFFLNNSFITEAATTFKIVDLPSIQTSKNTYEKNEKIVVNLSEILPTNGDWVGIYPKEASTAWENVVSWSYTNGTTSMNSLGISSGSLSLDGVPEGEYEARIFFNNSYDIEAKVDFNVVSKKIGAREVEATSLELNEDRYLFASPTGTGDCSKLQPCSIYSAVSQLQANNILFLRGGTYNIKNKLDITSTGTINEPIIIESYPGELAILDGQNQNINDIQGGEYSTSHGIMIHDGMNYIRLRKIEVKKMAAIGIAVTSSHNIVEGCKVHNNYNVGIQVNNGNNGYIKPYINGSNIIRDNTVYQNSDVILAANGGNADGIQIVSGINNVVSNNTVFENSDDGIDTWRSEKSIITFNISHHNGDGENGNGDGFKAGAKAENGLPVGSDAILKHNISYQNRKRGFDHNDGSNVIMKYNTSFENQGVGYKSGVDSIVEYNIAQANTNETPILDLHSSNSWQENEEVIFISTDPSSNNFLKPITGSIFENFGVYSHLND